MNPEQVEAAKREFRALLREAGFDMDRPMSTEEQLIADSMLYGMVCFTVDASGQRHRVDPTTVAVRNDPNP